MKMLIDSYFLNIFIITIFNCLIRNNFKQVVSYYVLINFITLTISMNYKNIIILLYNKNIISYK